MEERPNYYAIIPANVRYDSSLRDKAKLLYGEITSLSNKNGYCYASNKYFADLYEVSPTTISTLISELVDKGYLESKIIYKEGTKEILNRYLKIFKDNNTSNNNKNNKKKYIKKEFKKPTLEEVEAYVKERNSTVNPKTFYDYYEVNDWEEVKNWKQKLITWENHQHNNKQQPKEELPDWFKGDEPKVEINEQEQQEFDDILGTFK